MPGTFNEAQAEKMVIDACVAAGWHNTCVEGS